MDPVSYLFSAYLQSVHNKVYASMTESMGTQLKAVVVEYEGSKIPFQHQLWQIRSNSVCANTSQNIAQHSECTMKAGRMFNEICQSLSANPSKDLRYIKSRNMYCNAAVTFKPVVAKLGASKEKSDLSLTKSACNAATIEAMGSHDPRVINQRDKACDHYKKLKPLP